MPRLTKLICLVPMVMMSSRATGQREMSLWIPPASCVVDPIEHSRQGVESGTGRIINNQSTNPDGKLSIHCPIILLNGTDNAGESWGLFLSDLDSMSTSVFVYDNSNETGLPCTIGSFCGTVDAQYVVFESYNGGVDALSMCDFDQTGQAEYGVLRTLHPSLTNCPTGNAVGASVHIQLPPQDASPAGSSRFDGVKVQAP